MKKLLNIFMLISMLLLFWREPLAARTVTDLSGRTIDLPDRIERVIALRGALSLICYLGLVDRVAGVEYHEIKETRWIGSRGRSYRMANPVLGKLPVVGSRNRPQPEKIINISPDVIFLGSSATRIADQLQRQTSIPVVVVDVGDLGAHKNRFYMSIKLIGEICGKQERAQELIDRIENSIADLERRTADLPPKKRKKVYIGGLQFKVAHGILGTSRDYPPFKMVNAINVVDKLKVNRKLVKGRFSINPEIFIKLKPDAIFICESGLNLVVQELRKPLFLHLPAVKNGRVYGLLPHYYSADPATVLAEAYYVGKVLYPDRFQDVEIKVLADDLYSFFVGRPLYNEMAKIFGGFKALAGIKCRQ